MRWNRVHDEDGVGLVDVMVGIVLMTIVMSIASVTAIHAMKIQRRQVAEVDVANRGRTAIERMTREIRAANPLLLASTDGREISVQVTRGTAGPVRKITTYRVNGSNLEVSGSVIDLTTQVSTPTPTRTLITGLSLAPGDRLFDYKLYDGTTPTPTSDLRFYRTVRITLPLAVPGTTTPLVIGDTVTIRNSSVPS